MSEQQIQKRPSSFPQYSKNFNLHPLDVIDHSFQIRKQLEDFIDAFKKRIDLELNYSKSLISVSKSLDKYIKPGTQLAISFISSAFKVEHEQRGKQALELAESLKTQIQVVCTQIYKSNGIALKKMEKEVKKFYKQAQSYEQNFRRAFEDYARLNKDTQQMIITKNIMKYTTGIPQEKKIKLISKTMDSIKENKEYEKVYLQCLKEFNLFANNYNKQVTIILDQCQNQVREQIILEGDCLRKLIVAQVSMFKNIQYDLLNISKQMEVLDTQRDVEVFTEEQKSNMANPLMPLNEDRQQYSANRTSTTSAEVSNTLEIKKVIGKSILSESLLYVQDEYFAWMLQLKRNKNLRSIIQKTLKFYKQRQQKSLNSSLDKQNIITQQFKSQETEIETQKQQKQTQQNGQTKIDNSESMAERLEHEKELMDLLLTLKLQSPPSLIFNDKLNYNPSVEELFDSFLEITYGVFALWNNQDLTESEVNDYLQNLQRHFFKHHFYRLIGYIFIEEYRIQHEVMIQHAKLATNCGKLIKAILHESSIKNDVFVIKGVLGLIFTFNWLEEKGKRPLYQNIDVYHSEIWKKGDFWEAAIFETTYQQMANFIIQKGETQAETGLRQKNLIFSQLASYCHYMVMLGITSKNVRSIVGRYCRLYEMSEEQNKDLSKMITNTTKQYKELSPQLLNKVIGVETQ